MATFSQETRPFRVYTPLEPDKILLQRFSGEEGLSRPFRFTLELLSGDESVDPGDLLREPMIIQVDHPEEMRIIHGLVRRFVQLGRSEDLTMYQAEVVPWLWFLTLSQDCKIFQNKSVLDIAKEVFDGLGYPDYEFRTTHSYQPREYCVQYRETHFNFISRLFEEEGIFYFFEHTEDGHVLVIADDNSVANPCPGQPTARLAAQEDRFQDEDVVLDVRLESAVRPGSVNLRDYDFTRPSLNLESSAAGDDGVEEVYVYPGEYSELSEGERYAQLMLEEGQRSGALIRGMGTCRQFRGGFRFDLEDHYRADVNGPYLIVQVTHHAEAGDYRSWDTAPMQYRNGFIAQPLDVSFRPPRTNRAPRIHGTQTALVVGKSGEEIWTDEYGRVKVQFYWDRLGEKDENSSCWIRVSQPWAGKAWGGIHLPRIGQEVIVEFLEGDPDRPVITGRVYNAEQTVPYGLPDNKTQSGIKSRSSKGGSPSNFNEIRMEDKKGSEQLYIHAEKDLQQVVENDQTTTVGHDQTTTVKNDQTTTVEEGNQSITVGKGNRSVHVAEGKIEESAKEEITGTSTTKDVTFTAETFYCSQVASGKSNVQGNKDGSTQVWGEQRASLWSKQLAAIDSDDGPVEITAGTKADVTASDEIKLSVGGASITITSSQIEITAGGSSVTLSSGGVSIQGTQVKLNS